MRKMNKSEQSEKIRQRARELAKSGSFGDWWAIEVELREEGFSHARDLLDDERTRDELDRLCKEAQKRNLNSI